MKGGGFLARWFIRKPTFSKVLGAYRSQFRRALMRLFFPWAYGKKGMGWLRNPRKAFYNWWYNRTSVSLFPRAKGGGFFALLAGLFLLPFSGSQSTSKHSSSTTSGESTSVSSAAGTSRFSGVDSSVSSNVRSSSNVKSSSNVRSSSNVKTSRTSDEAAITLTKPKAAAAKSTGEAKIHPAFQGGQSSIKKSHLEQPLAFQKAPLPPPVTSPAPPPATAQIIPDPADETIPKSTPCNPADRYIRKRMLIAGTYFADQTAVDRLTVGAHIDLTAEPDNPHDPNAVALYHQGGKVGYVAKQDAISFAMCLRLKRPVYGIITDIRKETGRTVYEYETWFAAH